MLVCVIMYQCTIHSCQKLHTAILVRGHYCIIISSVSCHSTFLLMYATKVCINTTVWVCESLVKYDVLEVQFTDMKQECQRLDTTRETMKSYKLIAQVTVISCKCVTIVLKISFNLKTVDRFTTIDSACRPYKMSVKMVLV